MDCQTQKSVNLKIKRGSYEIFGPFNVPKTIFILVNFYYLYMQEIIEPKCVLTNNMAGLFLNCVLIGPI